jgi:hypothetical protein
LRHLEAGLRFSGIDVVMSSVKLSLSIMLGMGPSGMPETPTMLEEKWGKEGKKMQLGWFRWFSGRACFH